MPPTYDFIGDIHGYADELERLLQKLDYQKVDGVYQHASRQAFFVGDFIDRGPNIRRVLEIVKAMCDAGNAKAVMGNHEYNALCYHTRGENGHYLRAHSEKNQNQLNATHEQFAQFPKEWEDYLNWFLTLPVFYEEETFRVVHACWDNQIINRLKQHLQGNQLSPDTLLQSAKEGSALCEAIDTTLKGKELKIPNGLSFHDKDGNERHHVRIKWWLNALETTFKKYSINQIEDFPNHNMSLHQVNYYKPNEKPVFFGHYWLQGSPNLYRGNICCIDYSVAKGGHLAAYRFNGEQQLSNQNFVFV